LIQSSEKKSLTILFRAQNYLSKRGIGSLGIQLGTPHACRARKITSRFPFPLWWHLTRKEMADESSVTYWP
jgi:hypothetical protein